MPSLLANCSTAAQRLHQSVLNLAAQARLLKLPPLAGRGWYESLQGKLLPQLGQDTFLIVAIVGGTNIGKSVVFNMLAGASVSRTSPNASGTKHPVCLVPPGFTERHSLEQLFAGFTLRPWQNADEALQLSDEDYLFWQTGEHLPANLLILDTPDIDSDARVNWARAEKIRTAADVLIAVLTQEKHNDAAIKQFFRAAAGAEKSIITVFNKLDIDDDETYWPGWLEVFCRGTNVIPELVYLSPRDRDAVKNLTLPFFERHWSPPLAGGQPVTTTAFRNPEELLPDPTVRELTANVVSPELRLPRSLANDLSRLHFDEVKLRSLRGSLDQLLDDRKGVPCWLQEVRAKSAIFRDAEQHTFEKALTSFKNWPPLPTDYVFSQFWGLWKERRTGWRKAVTDVYDGAQHLIATPFRAALKALGKETVDPLVIYRQKELEASLAIAETMFSRLKMLGDAGGELIRPHFKAIATGPAREQFLKRLREKHNAPEKPLPEELREIIKSDMNQFLRERPHVAKWLERLDLVVVGSRPALSVALFMTGVVGVDVAAQPLIHLAVDLFAGTAAAATGEPLLTKGGGKLGSEILSAWWAVAGKFAERRVAAVNQLFHEEVLGTLPEQLKQAANLPESPAFRSVEQSLEELERVLKTPSQATTSAQAADSAISSFPA